MTVPTLLLSPEESRAASGPVSPTITGAVSTTAGQYGPAWQIDTAGKSVTLPDAASYVTTTDATVLLRVRFTADRTLIPFSASSRLMLGRMSGNVYTRIGSLAVTSAPAIPLGQAITIGVRYADGQRQAIANGTLSAPSAAEAATVSPYPIGMPDSEMAVNNYGFDIEGVLLYDVAIPDAEFIRVSTLPETWTWDNVQASPRRIFPILKVGSQQHIGPLRAGKA